MIKAENTEHLKKLIKEVIEGKLKLNDIDVSNIEDFSYVFYQFDFAHYHGSIENWNVSKGLYFVNMFYDCRNLNFDFKNWNMTKALNCNSMFYNCKDFLGNGLNYWHLPNLQYANHMFYNCQNLDIDVSNWDFKNIKSLIATFRNCYKFRGIGLEKLNISNITNLIQTFYNCYVLDCDFSNWKIDKNTIIEETFYNCFNLKGKGLKNWIIDISYEKIFKNCYSLNELPTLYDETKK